MEGPTVASQSEQLLPQQQQQQLLEIEEHAEGTATATTPLNANSSNNQQNIFRTPPTPSRLQHQSRQAAWWQSSVVRRSSSAVDEAVDELTEKSQFLLRKSPRTPRTSSSGSFTRSGSSSSDTLNACLSSDDPLQRLDSPQEEPEVEDAAAAEEEEEEEVLTAAPFYRHEIQVGQLLGEGAFSCVYEVTGFDLVDSSHNDDRISPAAQQLRESIAAAPPGRFALKHLKADLLANTKDFEDAATDLVMEAKYLGALYHPNILTLRGLPMDGTAAFANQGEPGHYHDGFFILTDRLTETLAQRIERWKSNPDDDPTNTVLNKTRFALQIADGISFLHQQRIIFRDLKPSNIGFNADDDSVKLFDFGLVRELPPPKRARPYRPYIEHNPNDEFSEYSEYMDESWNEDDDDLDADVVEEEEDLYAMSELNASSSPLQQPQEEQCYYMSGAGTQIYMAPEILLQNRYNLKADVYSWAMTVTEMLLLEKPLPWYPMDEHIQYVAKEGDRPRLEDGLIPDSLRDLLAWAWEGNVAQRCTMDQAREELQDIIVQIEEAEQQEATADTVLCWPARLVEAASCIQAFFRGIFERTCQGVRALFVRTNREQPKSRDVTFDLAATETATENVDPVQSDPPPASDNHDENNENSASSFSASSDQQAEFPASPDGNHDCHTNSSNSNHNSSSRAARAAMWKRKPSSASTTAMTDDECDDDMIVMTTMDSSSPCKTSASEEHARGSHHNVDAV